MRDLDGGHVHHIDAVSTPEISGACSCISVTGAVSSPTNPLTIK
jgi:hypothetical protein